MTALPGMRRAIAAVVLLGCWTANAQNLGSLKRVPAPQPSGVDRYVQDPDMLVVLGKALFWDMQTGSDGRTACATCHFHAGADHRAQNQLSNAHGAVQVNYTLGADDFPFHVKSNPNDRGSTVVRDTPAVAGSAGVFRRLFGGVIAGDPFDLGEDVSGESLPFTLHGLNTRQVTSRNSPSVINAVFNVRNFWDGRASDIFTGSTPFGDSDRGLRAVNIDSGTPVAEAVRITNASLASQAVGPLLNEVEMSYIGRTWPAAGRRILALRPLALQQVAADDSVLGRLANIEGRGLNESVTYLTLVRAAFRPSYWDSEQLVDAAGAPSPEAEYSVAEYNFPLFWGLALQAYQATLVADDSRVDRFFDGDISALTQQERQGMQLFQGRGECQVCHGGAEFTLATFSALERLGPVQIGGRGGNAAGRDTGFFRTGVRPIGEDVGLGDVDPFGTPFSVAVQRNPAARQGVQGLFKTPGLRNVEFTGPYQHNGGQSTLEQVVDFYARGGDFPEGGNLGPDIENHNLSDADRAAIVAFMKALSDDRVRFERAPFDHPELCVPVGHVEGEDRKLVADSGTPQFRRSAADRWAGIPAVGRNGNRVALQTFEELLRGAGADGSRAHSLQDGCRIFE